MTFSQSLECINYFMWRLCSADDSRWQSLHLYIEWVIWWPLWPLILFVKFVVNMNQMWTKRQEHIIVFSRSNQLNITTSPSSTGKLTNNEKDSVFSGKTLTRETFFRILRFPSTFSNAIPQNLHKNTDRGPLTWLNKSEWVIYEWAILLYPLKHTKTQIASSASSSSTLWYAFTPNALLPLIANCTC